MKIISTNCSCAVSQASVIASYFPSKTIVGAAAIRKNYRGGSKIAAINFNPIRPSIYQASDKSNPKYNFIFAVCQW